jgi:gliding motility-associated lipoprotein GldH
MRKLYLLTFGIFLCGLAMQSCTHIDMYQKQVALNHNVWDHKELTSFEFDIEDTAAHYQLYFLIRHTDAYPFSNIWLSINTQMPGDKKGVESKVEIPLADKNGKWLGRGTGEIFEQLMPLSGTNGYTKFTKKGKYKITFQQIMRENPLPEILQVGLRVEKQKN